MFDAKITVRSRLDYLTQIKALLNGNRSNLFRLTVFGPWIDIPPYAPDNHLYNFFYQNQVRVDDVSDHSRSLIFEIGDNTIQFSRENFSLITGFSLGQLPKDQTDVGRYVHGLEHSPFFDRLFPTKKGIKKKKLRVLSFCNI